MTAAKPVRTNGRARASAALLLSVVSLSCEGPNQPLPPEHAPVTIERLAGATPQVAMVGTAVPLPPTIRVLGAGGRPVVGARVVFSVTRGGGQVSFPYQRTDSTGVAKPPSWLLGPTLGPNEVVAIVTSSTTDTRAFFTATSIVGLPASVGVTPGTVLIPVGGSTPLTVTHLDPYGNLVGPAIGVVFTSGNTNVATVTAGGVVSGVSLGVTTLTVTSGQLPVRTLTVAVGPQPTGEVVTSTNIGSEAFGIAVSSANVLYASAQSGAIRRFDLPSEAVGATISVPGGVYDVRFSSDGTTAYASIPDRGEIAVIDVASNVVSRTIRVGQFPNRLRLSPDGTTLYAGCYAVLARVNLANDSVTFLSVGTTNTFVTGLAIDPTQPRLFVTDDAGTIAEVSLTTFAVTRSTSIFGGVFRGIVVSLDGARLFLANGSNALTVRRTSDFALLATLPSASRAYDVALTRNGAQLYVARPDTNSLALLDALNYSVMRNIPINSPRRITFDAAGTTAVVTNAAGLTFIK